MAYSTGSATNVSDLLTKLEAFMGVNGWTTDSFATEGSGKRLHAHKGSVYFNARAYVAETPDSAILPTFGSPASCSALAFNISSAGTGGTRWFDKTGTPVGTSSRYATAGLDGITGAIPAYHFFAHNSGDAILVVVEYASGSYQYLGFGTLNKYGTYTGGVYFFGSKGGVTNTVESVSNYTPGIGFVSQYIRSIGYAPAYVTASVDSETGWHWSRDYQRERDATKRYVLCNLNRFVSTRWNQPNDLNGLAVLMPVEFLVERDTGLGSNAHLSPLGELPETHYLVIKNLTPSQQITLGSDNYRVFPFFRKNAAADDPSVFGTPHSSYWGFAVKE